MTDQADGWQRLDRRMLLVHPVRELVRFLPVLLALVVAGTASGDPGDWWHVVGVVVPVGLGILRYLTTEFRIAGGRVELKRGLLNRHVLSTPVDRVRTVDLTATPVHRLLGLTRVRVGTGTASSDTDEQVVLDGLPVARAARLRTDLLRRSPLAEPPPDTGPAARGGTPADPVAPVVRLDPGWVRFAPLTSSGLAIAAGVVGLLSQTVNTLGGLGPVDPRAVADDASRWSPWAAVPLAILAAAVLVSLLAIGGYLVTNWGFTLTRAPGAWHLRRGLLTTRETTLDEERLRGVTVAEPLGLRLARGARASAIVTGLGRGQRGSASLVPAAPRAVVVRAAGEVLGSDTALRAPLVPHGPRARARRWTRALGPAALLVVLALVAVALGAPWWVTLLALVGLPVAAALAADRSRALGHRLAGGYLVVRAGSLDRRTEAVEVDGVIGWNLRATWFQRRAGLTTLVATTAGGRQAVTAVDVPDRTALAVAREAHPHLLDQFLAPVSPERRPGAPGRGDL